MSSFISWTEWDLFLVIALLLFTWLGWLRGIARSVFGLMAWGMALVYAPSVSRVFFGNDAPFFGFVIGFIVVWLSVRYVGAGLSFFLSKIGLGLIDRAMGAASGLLIAIFFVGLVALAGHTIGADLQPAWQHSVARPLLDMAVSKLNWLDVDESKIFWKEKHEILLEEAEKSLSRAYCVKPALVS